MSTGRPPQGRGLDAGSSGGNVGADRSGSLWTCRGCHRNNEARLDACYHCRSRAPPRKTNQGSTFATNPYERFIRGGSNSIAGNPGGVSRRSGLALPTSARGQGQTASRTANMVRGASTNAGQGCHLRSGNAVGGTSRCKSSTFSAPARRPRRLVPIDPEAAGTWIYPVNYPVRKYQQQIVTAALFSNTLVALPTGLGKTLIAAVVMYNFYRWFPEGKVVFLAPTKPLVAQQISACYDIMGVAEKDTAELQGSVAPEKRRELWRERRVFFCTPQSMVNDIKQKRCDPGRFVCVVVDEAHRGTGNYAYVNVIREVAAATPYFRVLALSATPGSDTKAIQQVLVNLRISHIECRSEDDPEVAKHTHARQIEVVRCKLGDHMDAIRQNLVAVLQPLVSRMANKRVLFTRDPMALKAWGVLEALKTFRRTAHDRGGAHMAGEVEAEMAILTKVVQAKEVLLTHGAAGCLNKLANMEDEVRRRGFRSNAERGVMQHEAWGDLMKLLRQTAENTAGLSTKHPKLIKLREVLREHFGRHQAAGKSTRAIVFTQWRDSVEEITDFLADDHLLRVKAFIGQGNSSGAKARAVTEAARVKAAHCRGGDGGATEADADEDGRSDGGDPLAPKPRLKGQTQKEQKAVVKAFFAGEFNCLVATCIAEEGLDIGEVDLIVSFDALSSPVRMVQRMGRTGRKRAGKVVVLVTEGAEESKLRNSNSKSKSITKTLQTRKDKFDMFQRDDPMVPPGPRPRMVEQEMIIDEYHLSQVGGHPRKVSRKSGGGAGGGTGAGASAPRDDWRLTAEQKATLAEAYSDEPGTERYVPDAVSGWKRQKNPWATGTVARSARSRLLCEIKDFVAHQEWELLYDPVDMQLILATLRDEEKASPGSRESGRGTHDAPSRCGGDAGDGGGGNGSAHPAPSSDPDNDDFETHPKRRNDKRPGKPQQLHDRSIDEDERGGGVQGDGDNVIAASAATATIAAAKRSTCKPRKGVRGKASADARGGKAGGKAGDGVGRVEPRAQKPDANADNHEARNGIGRGTSSRDAEGGEGAGDASAVSRADLGCQNPRGKMIAGTPSAVTLVRRATVAAGTRKAQASVAQEAKAAPIAARGGQPAGSCTEGVQGEVNVVGQERSQACRREWTDVGGSGSMNDTPGEEGGENDDDDEETQSDPEFRSSGVLQGRAQNGGARSPPPTIGRWCCDCGCLVKPGRSSCRVCGGKIMASVGDAGASSSSSTCKSRSPSVSVLEPKKDDGDRLSLPDQACDKGKTSLSLKVSSTGLFGHSADGGHPTGGSQASRNTTGSGSNGMKADSRSDASSRSQAGRWQCGCGCRMRVGRKRCVMCGQPKPSEGSGETGVSSDISITHRKDPDGGLTHGDERVTPHRAEAGGARGGHSGSSSGGRSSETSAVEGSWQCSGCGNEYVATRTKCRSCGTPKPSTEARAAPDDQTAPQLRSSGCSADHPDDGGTEPGFTLEASCPGQPQVCADRAGDAAPEAFAGEEDASSVHSRVRDLSAGQDRAVPLTVGRWRGKRSRSSSAALVGNDTREDAPFVANKRPPEDLAASPAVGSGRNGSDRDHIRSGSASETPSSRNIGLDIDDLRSPRTDASSQSQDDGLAELFPSLHRFEAGESAAAGGGCRATNRGARPSFVNSSRCAAAVRIADSFAALPSPLVAPPPSLCVSSPPLPVIGKSPTCLTGPIGASARSAQGSDGDISVLPSQSLVGSRSHEAVIRDHTAASSPSSRARIDLAVSTDGGAVRSTEEVPGFYDGAIVGTSGRSGGGGPDPSTRSESPHGAAPKIGDVPPTEVAFPEESVVSVAGAACVSATIPSTVERTSADGVRVTTSSSSATAAGERDCRIESGADEKRGEELVSDKAPLRPACASDGESVNNNVEGGNTRRGATEREVQVEAVADGGDDSGRPRKNVGGEENRRDDDDDLACGVCGSTASEEEDPIILCEGLRCQTAVHAGCYGVVKVPEGQWLCDPCSEVSKEAAQKGGKGDGGDEGCNYGSLQPCCELCTHKGGALKRSRCGRWVHLVCIWWTPELSTEPDTVRPRPLTELDPGRADLTCSACHRRGGAAVRCAANRCVEACHPFCAMRAGQVLAEENGVFELFCKLHSRQLERHNDKEEGREPEGKLERCASTRVEGKAEAGTKASGDDDCDADVFMGSTTTPRGRKGARELAPGDTLSTCVSTPSSHAARDGAHDGGGSKLCRGETRGEPWEEGYGGVLPAGTEMTQGPIPPRRHPAGSRAEKLRKKRALLDLEDDDDDGEDEGIDADSVVMSGGRGIAAMTEGWQDSPGGGVTPPKIFDMAPPREKQPRPPPTGGVDERASRRARGTATATNASTDKRRSCLSLPSPVPSSLSKRQQQQQPDGRRISPPEKSEACSPGGGVDHEGGKGGMMTLSQAVSPTEEDRQGKGKRRRLRKYESPGSSSEIGERCAKDNADEDARAATKERRSGGGERLKRGARECDYDKAAYRRFIDHEAEVDEDLSDDDEAAILDEYDSEDSFVNDGPLSYETCSSQEEGTPSRPRETSVDGADDDVARRRAKRRRGGIEDEKGMYLQLLAESPSPNPYLRGSGDVVGSSGRRRLGRRHRTGRGGGSDRFAFINAVMAHARDGGDPLDIEEACRSNGFTQEGYAGTPKTTSPSQDGANTATEWSSCGAVSSGGSGVSSGRQASRSGGGRDAQPMYSQALRQAAHPESPSSPQARDDASPAPGKPAPRETGKENAPCATASADERSSLIGSDAGDPGWRKGERRDSTVDDDITRSRSDGDTPGATTPGVGGAEALPLGRRNANCALGDRAAPADRSKEAVGGPSAASSGDGFSRGARLGADTAAAVAASTGAARVGGVAIGVGGDHGEAGSKGNGKGSSLTDRQRQIMLENREKALARLKQRQHQQQAVAAAKAGVGRPVGAIVAAPEAAAGTQQVRKTVQVNPSGRGASSWSLAEVKQSLTGATQRERFRMTMDMESDDDSDVENSTGRDVPPQPPPTALAASSSSSTSPAVALENAIRDTTGGASKSPTIALGEAADAQQRSGSSSRRSLPFSIAPSTPPPTKPPASASGLEASLTTLPLSAPRASDLESLVAELRSREGFAVHAAPLGGGSRDVDLAVGSQCAVCVRSIRQFLAQTQVTSGGGNPAFVGAGESARVRLVTLLEAGLQRYARIAVIVEGLGGDQQQQQRLEAVDKVEALRGASVVASSGWRETADKVVALVEQEAASGHGLPAEVLAAFPHDLATPLGIVQSNPQVNGLSLNTAQEKFLAFLLRAPTLSYPGGLYLLQAFRGRSGKEMIASSAKELQSAVPGMKARQAAMLKRFLASGGRGGSSGAARPIASRAAAVEAEAKRQGLSASASQRARP